MFEYDPLIDPLLPIGPLDLLFTEADDLFDSNGELTENGHEELYQMEQNGEFS